MQACDALMKLLRSDFSELASDATGHDVAPTILTILFEAVPLFEQVPPYFKLSDVDLIRQVFQVLHLWLYYSTPQPTPTPFFSLMLVTTLTLISKFPGPTACFI